MDKGYKRPTKRSRDLRENMTEAELKLWAHLSARKVAGARFNTQFPIGQFICDFVSRSSKLVIEVDGATHGESERADAARTHYIENRGYRVIRFWNNDVMGNVEGVVSEIERVLREMGAVGNKPFPNPSRKREGNREGTARTAKLPSRLREGLGEGMSANARKHSAARLSNPAFQRKRDK